MAVNEYVPKLSRDELLDGTDNQNSKYAPTISRNDLLLGSGITQEKIDQADFEYNRPDTSSFGTSLVNGMKGIIRAPISATEGLINLDRGQSQRLRSEYLVKNEGMSKEEADKIAASEYSFADWSHIRNSDWLRPTENQAPSRKPVKQFFLDVAENAPQVAAQAAITYGTGGLAGGAFMGSQIAGGSYEGLVNEGVAPDRAMKAGLANAAIQTPMEQLAIGKWFGKGKGSKIGNFADIVGTEAATEALQEYPEAGAHLWAKSPDKNFSEMAQAYVDDLDNTTKDALYSGLIGGTFGLVGGAGNLAANRKRTQAPAEYQSSGVSYMADSNNENSIDAFMNAISGQESGGNYDALNPHTGASGRFQIMPENWPSWAENAGIGKDAPRTPENQDFVARHKMQEYYNQFGNWKDVAIAWYAGPGAVEWSEAALNRPQYEYDSAGNPIAEYPSINSYADSIMGKMGEAGSSAPFSDSRNKNYQESRYDFTQEDLPIGEVKPITDPEIVRDYIGRTFDGEDLKSRIPVRKVTEQEASLIKELTGIDVTDFTHIIDMDSIRHSIKRHSEGKENAADQVGMTKEDYQYIPDVILNPDRIELGSTNKRTKNKTLRYIKNIDGRVFVAEEILDNKKTLVSKTMWKKAPAENHVDMNTNLHHTSKPDDVVIARTDGQEPSSNNSILDQNKNFSKSQMPGGIYEGMNYNDTDGSGPTIARREIINQVNELFDIPVRYGRLGKNSKNIKGWHDSEKGIIRIGERFDWDTISHEIGHHLDDILGNVSAKPQYRNELSQWVQKNFGNRYKPEEFSKEGVAEFFRQYLTNPEAARSNFPGFYGEIDSKLQENPKILKKLKAIQKSFDTWRNQSPEARVSGSISYGQDSKLSDLAKNPKQAWQKIKEAGQTFYDKLVEELAPLDRMVEQIEKKIGHELPENLQIYEKARLFRGWAGKAETLLGHGDPGKAPAFTEIVKLIKGRRKEFGGYLIALREKNARDLQQRSEDQRRTAQLQAKLANSLISETSKDIRETDHKKAVEIRQEAIKAAREGRDEEVAKIKENRKEIYQKLRDEGATPYLANKKYNEMIQREIRKGNHNIQKAKEEARIAEEDLRKSSQKDIKKLQEGRVYASEIPEAIEYTYVLSEKDMNAVIEKYARDPEFQKARSLLRQYNNNLLDILVEGGLKTQKDVNYLKEKWPDYVPFYRDFSEEGSSDAFIAARGMANISDPMKIYQGSKRDIIDPIESIIKNTFDFVNRVEANKVSQTLIDISKMPGMGHLVEEVDGATNPREGVLSVWTKGEKKMFQVPEDIHRALTGMNDTKVDPLIKALSIPEQVLRMTSTVMEPAFALTNTVRDTFEAYLRSEHGFLPIVDNIRGLKSFLQKDALYWEWMNSGGANSHLVALDRNSVAKAINQMGDRSWREKANLEQVKYVLSYIAEASEVATRLGIYRKARTKGASMHKAALESRDVTIDFSRAGSAGKRVNKLVAFFNAGVQDIDKVLRFAYKNPVTFSTRIATGVSGLSALLFLAQHDDERWKELMRRDRDRFWFVIPGALSGDKITKEKWDEMIASGISAEEILERSGTIYKIPKPFTVGVIFGSGAERTLDWMMNDNPDAFKGFADSFMEVTAPNMMPSIMRQAAEWITEYNFFRGRPVVDRQLQGLPEYLQYNSRTSEVGKWIGEKFNVSPMKVDNAIIGSGGLFGRGLEFSDKILGADNKRPASKLSEAYGIRRFTSQPFAYPQTVDDYYSEFDRQSEFYEEKKITGKTSDDFDPKYFGRLKLAKKDMAKLTKAERETRESQTMTAEQKRTELDKIGIVKLELAKKALKR